MYTIKKVVNIPENRKLHIELDLPCDFPAGEAEVICSFNPLGNSHKQNVASLVPTDVAKSIHINADLTEALDVKWDADGSQQ